MKKVFALVLAMLMVMAMFAGCGGKKNYAANNTVFKIGASGPLTGGASMYGIGVKNAAQMAVEEINAAGGLNGVMFELVMMDDKHDAANVPTNYAALLEGGMQVSLGTVTTAPGLEWTNLSEEDNVFFLTPSASGDKIPTKANGYQMCFADSNQGVVAAKYINENYANKSVGVFYKSDDDYSKGIFTKFMESLKDGIDVIETSFTTSSATDFSVQIGKLKDCDLIFMPIYYDPASLFMKQGKDIVNAATVYYGCDGFDGIDNIKGFDITTVPQKVIMLSHFNSKAESGAAKTFADKYKAKYGADTLNQFAASAYDCVYAIYGAMKAAQAAGKDISVTISPAELCKILQDQFNGGYTLKNGVTGDEIKWESTGFVNKEAVQYVIKEAN